MSKRPAQWGLAILRDVFARQEAGLVCGIVIILGLIALLDRNHAFFSQSSVFSVIHQIALYGVLALGAAVIIISGGIDLSVGSIVGLSSVTIAMLAMEWLPGSGAKIPNPAVLYAAIGLTILMGAAIGLLHAWLINSLKLPPFIATLATLAGLRSLAKILSGNRKPRIPDELAVWGNTMSYSLTIFLIVTVIVGILMGYTVLGRQLYALGGNENAARLSGLPIARLRTIAYCLSGALAALCGILFTGKIGQGDPTLGQAFELFAITAAVVGGCSLRGGFGTIPGTVLGLILIQIIIKGTGIVVNDIDISLFGFSLQLKLDSTQIEGLVLGAVIVLAVAFNQKLRKIQST